MLYVLVGLTCSAVGCQWWKPAYEETFQTEQACLVRAAEIKPKTVMYFDLRCETVKNSYGS